MILDLPSTPVDADPVIVPGLLRALGITPRSVPDWITDPDTRESIALGLMDLPDSLTEDAP